MPDQPLLICGQGRCGTSLCLQMLQAGGMPVIGTHPAFEDPALLRAQVVQSVAEAFGGYAVKWLNPIPVIKGKAPPMRIVYLVRNTSQQARSQIKLLGIAANRQKLRALAASIRHDDECAVRALGAIAPVQVIRFEQMITDPILAAQKLAVPAVHYCPAFDVKAAAARVLRRTPSCAPDMAIEMAMLATLPPRPLYGQNANG
jgi:hypothetical protein